MDASGKVIYRYGLEKHFQGKFGREDSKMCNKYKITQAASNTGLLSHNTYEARRLIYSI